MKTFNSLVSLVLILFLSTSISAQIFSDNFGTTGGGLSSTSVVLTDQCFDNTDLSDYFGVVLEDEINQTFVGTDGAFLAGQDMDGTPCTTGAGVAEWTGINTAGQTGLVLCLDIAEGIANDGAEDWDADSQVTISVSVGGTAEVLGTITAQGATNTFPGFDCTGDGVGDGIEITDAFTTFCFSISGTGSSMGISIAISGLDAGDEDIAIDNVEVYSNSNPTSTVLNAACGGVPGCTDAAACNYDASATVDNSTCYNVGDSCDDEDITTSNDVWINCSTCQGTGTGLVNCGAPVWQVVNPTPNVNAFNNYGQWGAITDGYGVNGYCGADCAEPVDTWLIYGPLDLSSTSALSIIFDASEVFGITDLIVAYTSNFPTSCPNTASWTTAGTVTESGTANIDLSGASGNGVYIGIAYTDDGVDGYSSWELTNFQLLANNCPTVGTSVNFNCATDIGCTDASACNYDPTAELDNGSCFSVGDTCDDENVTTTNDVITAACECAGTAIGGGTCPTDAVINEFHYDNTSTDINEFVEIALPVNADPTQIRVDLYNGSNGTSYNALVLSAADFVSTSGGFDYYVWYPESIQNGNDGIAVSCLDGTLYQFITYEGAFMAADGPFANEMGIDIGVEETGDMADTQSIMNDGAGNYIIYCTADAGSANDIASCGCDPAINDCFMVCTQTINLNPGWNLVSLDLTPDDRALQSIFNATAGGNIEFITGFDNGAKVFDPNGPPFLNTVNEVVDGFGYWVKAINADVIMVEGACLDDTFRKPFDAGWNLVLYNKWKMVLVIGLK